MKKSNVILTAVAGVASIFLLWLWFHLGFNQVDSPLDLFLSIIWWLIIGIGAAAIVKLEKTRRERIRTVYLGDSRLYNSEVGVQMMTPGVAAADALASIINALEYDFDRVDGPDPDNESERINWRYIVHTAKYQVDEDEDGRPRHDRETWEGDVVIVSTGETRAFSSRAELAALIA